MADKTQLSIEEIIEGLRKYLTGKQVYDTTVAEVLSYISGYVQAISHMYTSELRKRSSPQSIVQPIESRLEEEQQLKYIGNHIVIVGNRLVQLPKKGEAILSCLWEKPNEVCTYQELRDRIWNGVASFESIVQTVYRLRRKVELDPENPQFILTVRNKGYMIKI